jgi:hypothetical protein
LLKKYQGLEMLNLADNGFRFSASEEAKAALAQLYKLKRLKINSQVHDYSAYRVFSEDSDTPMAYYFDEHDRRIEIGDQGQIDDSTIKILAQLPNLQSLYITCNPPGYQVSNSALDDLVTLTNLKKLRLCVDDMVNYDDKLPLMKLAKLRNLEYLWLDDSCNYLDSNTMQSLRTALPNTEIVDTEHDHDYDPDDLSEEDDYEIFYHYYRPKRMLTYYDK